MESCLEIGEKSRVGNLHRIELRVKILIFLNPLVNEKVSSRSDLFISNHANILEFDMLISF